MNWKELDNQFREKLENIPEEYDEKEWERFNKKFDTRKISMASFWQKNLLKIAASIGITGLVFFSTAQFVTNKKLNTQLEKIEIQNNDLLEQREAFEQKIEVFISLNDSLKTTNEQFLASIKELKNSEFKNNLDKKRKIVKSGKKKVKVKAKTEAKPDTLKKEKFFGKLIKGFKGLFKGKKSKKADSTEVEIEVDSVSIKN